MPDASAEVRGRGARRGARGAPSGPRALLALTAGAVLLRVLLFFGRGDFVAFDEGWYLLLGQSLWAGNGFRLTGLRHTALSPLFPVVAGGVAAVAGDPVWAGRTVAAVAGGLLVLPCWSLFRRLAGRRTAWLGCLVVAVMPSLSAFTVPYWVGWDLWMGPEPVYHLFVFTGFALALRGHDRSSPRDWALAGASFALAYLARPEAILIGGILGAVACGSAILRRSGRSTLQPLAFAIAFGVFAAPYWVYLHDALGRWALTGRHLP
ncbi:MAG TPA: glycosyltransferase family 39 protein, partial [Longimicrobiales bacterium]